jgi:X-X-X-Leu-X-X-Gly heptad repeat protein
MALRGLNGTKTLSNGTKTLSNGTKTLSNTILYYFKVTLNVNYIDKQFSPWSQKDMEEHKASTC